MSDTEDGEIDAASKYEQAAPSQSTSDFRSRLRSFRFDSNSPNGPPVAPSASPRKRPASLSSPDTHSTTNKPRRIRANDTNHGLSQTQPHNESTHAMDTTTDSPASAKARRRKANYTDHNLSSTNPNNAITQASQTTSFDRRIPPPNPAVTTSPSNSNRTKSAGYAPPSKYAHLPHLTDVLAPNLLILFVGLNPGITTATEGKSFN
ncbi:MAG: hypothetical protein Q9162_005438 [Coniocarpon cinnabarinum]